MGVGGEPAIPSGCGEEKKGRDFVQSLVYWAAVLVVDPKAESSGDVMG
jgi:hypothetical protein